MTELEKKIKNRETELQISFDNLKQRRTDLLFTINDLKENLLSKSKSLSKVNENIEKCRLMAVEQNCLNIL